MIARFLCSLMALLLLANSVAADEPLFELKPGDHVTYIGNTMADRMQHHAWLETYLHALHPSHELTFRNLGFAADEVKTRPRSDNFGDPDQWLSKCKTDVVFCFFGYNEALRGEAGLAGFKQDLAAMIDGMRAKKYNGKSAPRIVMFSPIAHEDLKSPHLPDGSDNNPKLQLYAAAMQQICNEKSVRFVDLFSATQRLYDENEQPLTMNGIHLLDAGNKAVAKVILKSLFSDASVPGDNDIKTLREAVLDKNYHWFSRYRVVDGYNVYGGRSKLAWHGQSNADVMRREMEIFDVLTTNRDKKIWAIAQGKQPTVKDNNLPAELVVKPNKLGPLAKGAFPYLDGEEAIKEMTVAKGMQVNLFASESMFPRLINPVQMAVDTDSRLWVSVWESYPHWNPTQPRKDALLIFPDDDGDGVADDCIVFADELNSVTSFEFWGGGVLVAAPPEIWFLKDTDGDNKADYKLRMLQGVSSADTHHSANAMVVGPDGWLYYSRGIFNVANFETPTKTFRSGRTGVHRFNPRTFEFEFHFPIGPNPHGDVFDQWGYQFANDGTSGTGSYVNIGKGVGNKQWFKKRVRPVAATGLLASSHFPEANQGNFLICNCITVRGVLQHEINYNGADITSEEVESILVSNDPNFRPSDLEIGGDGALYISDWHNALIGHMQHNMRDPNRDHTHGRIYRVTAKGRELVEPVKMKGKPIADVLQNTFAKENNTRYRVRLELSGRETKDVMAAVDTFTSRLDPRKADPNRDEGQALLECLWICEEHRVPNLDLVRKTFQAKDPRVRAAAIRTLGHWAGRVKDWEATLLAGARDDSALVRAEAVKSAVEFEGATVSEVIFEAATRPTDPEMNIVLKYARGRVDVDALVRDAIRNNRKLSPAAQAYALLNASVQDLVKLEQTEPVCRAILSRTAASAQQLNDALTRLGQLTKTDETALLVKLVADVDAKRSNGNLDALSKLIAEQTPERLKGVQRDLEQLATSGKSERARQVAYAAWIVADGAGGSAFLSAAKSKERLRDFLAAVPAVRADIRKDLYEKVQPLTRELPAGLTGELAGGGYGTPGIHVDYFYPSAKDVARETLQAMTPKAGGIVPDIVMNVPQLKQRDKFALRFTGSIQAPKTGRYTFYTASDDGSRLYIGDKLVVNNDGLHGMVERAGVIDLTAGNHPLLVTYFDNGGGDGLRVSWQGPGIRKGKIEGKYLSVGSGKTLHDEAIAALATVPGHDTQKFTDLAALVKAGLHRPAAIAALREVPQPSWPKKEVRPLVDNLIGYLTEMPARYRTGAPAMNAIALAKSLSSELTKEQSRAVLARLQNLDVRVIAIGTVPHRMIFDKEQVVVQAGKPVEFRFSNTDSMPHNFAITMPGSLEEVGNLAETTGRDPDAQERHFIPRTKKITLASKLLQPGQRESLSYEAPAEPGVYPYVCTYPGHWRRMYGALYVVADLDEYRADPEKYLAAHPLPIKDELLKYATRGREWKYEELISSMKPLPMGRSWEVGKQLFKVSSCVACHKLNDEGRVFGPDLAKLDTKKKTVEHILRSMIDPSKDIDEKFQSYTLALDSGKPLTGMITKETADTIEIVIDPLAKGKPTIVKKDEILAQRKSKVSLMPKGLLNKLSREEILDLVAYVFAGGDKKHMLFKGHHHKH